MPSHLRLQSSLDEPLPANIAYHHAAQHPAKKVKMSLTQTYYVASTARSKLGKEASRADHNLRLLVGHANLLDTLMVELADAEREQEAWFNQSVRKANKPSESRHIQWIDSIIEEDDESDDDSDDESDAGSDIYDEDADLFNLPLRKLASPPVIVSSEELAFEDDDSDLEEEDDEYMDDDSLALQRTSKHSPPELLDDFESESDEDSSMPSSPEAIMFEFDEKNMSSPSLFPAAPASTESAPLDKYASTSRQAPMIAAY